MALPSLTLRVRIFLFFALLAVAVPLTIGAAVWFASQAETTVNDNRLMATYAGVAAVLLMFLILGIWQLFDQYVGSALQTLARQMQTALHSDTPSMPDTESLRYLGPIGEAAQEIIAALHDLKQQSGQPDKDTQSVDAWHLAAIVQNLDTGTLVMNMQHQILLYNACVQQLLCAGGRPTGTAMGLGRSVFDVIDEATLRPKANALLSCDYSARRPSESVRVRCLETDRLLNARLRVFCDNEGGALGYLLCFDDGVLPVDGMDDDLGEQPVNTPVALAERPEFYDFDLFKRRISADVRSAPLRDLDFVVFDTETTGLNPSHGDEVISIGAVRIVNGRVLAGECFEELINPGRHVPASSTVFHGITDNMLVQRPDINVVLPWFKRFAGDSVLVAHNAAFDMKFLELKAPACHVSLDNPVLDTVLLSAWLHDHTHKHTLDELAHRFGLVIEERHTALGDAMATAEIFVRLVRQLAARGVNTLDEALTVSNQMTRIRRQQKAY